MPQRFTSTPPSSLYRASRLPTTLIYLVSVALLMSFGTWQYKSVDSLAGIQIARIQGQLQALYRGTATGTDKLSFERVLQGQLEQLTDDGIVNHMRITDLKGDVIFEHPSRTTSGLSRQGTNTIQDAQGQNVATAEVSINTFRPLRKLLLALLASFIGLTLIYWRLIDRLKRRHQHFESSLQQIASVFEKYQHSNLALQIEPNGSEELANLCNSVNQLGAYLEQTKKELDHQVRAASKEINQTLEELEIKNVELDLARKRAVESNEAKSSFLANISHEIRTPMHGIIGHLQLLHRLSLPPQQEEYVSRTLEASNSLLDIIDDTLNLTRIEANKLDIQSLPFDLIEDVSRCLVMQVPDAIKKGIDVYFLCEPEMEGGYIGDSLRVRQVFTNLLSNAIKYTEKGSIKVRLKTTNHSSNKRDTIQLQVSDTGLGMDSEQMESLFEAFSQAGRSPESGTGLGLLITRTLTEAMGGRLQLESEVGKGSVFTVTLPLLPLPRKNTPPYIASIGGRIGVECDDPEVKRYYERIVTDAHLKVHSNENTTADVTLIIISQHQLAEINRQGAELQNMCMQREDVHLVLLNTLNLDLMNQINQHTHCHSLPLTSDKLTVQSTLARLLNQQNIDHNLSRLAKTKSTPIAFRAQRDTENLEGINILLADDDNFGRNYMAQLLRECGAKVTACEDGYIAIDHAKKNVFDLILLDIRMPQCDGIQATEEIRKLPHASQTPIIGMTASVVPEQHQLCMLAGMTDYWGKPLQISQLMSGLRHWLNTSDGFFYNPEHETTEIGISEAVGQLDEEMKSILMSELSKANLQLESFEPSSNEFSELREMAHTLCGSAAICRLTDLRDAAAKLQKNTRSKDSEAVPKLIKSLETEISKVVQAIHH